MNTLSSWEAQTIELMRLIDEEIHEVKGRLDYLIEEKKVVEKALNTYRHRVGAKYAQSVQSIKAEEFGGKTLREMLVLIAERNDKLVVVKDAVKLLKEARVFGNPLHADSQVYSTLGRSPQFRRVGRGIFRLNGIHEQEKPTKRHGTPGLKNALKELKQQNPQITKKEAGNILVKRGFDFGGKKPQRAVHMAWVNMGYARKESPQIPMGISSDHVGGIPFMECPSCHKYRGRPQNVALHIMGVFDPAHIEWLTAQGFNPPELVKTGDYTTLIDYLTKISGGTTPN